MRNRHPAGLRHVDEQQVIVEDHGSDSPLLFSDPPEAPPPMAKTTPVVSSSKTATPARSVAANSGYVVSHHMAGLGTTRWLAPISRTVTSCWRAPAPSAG